MKIYRRNINQNKKVSLKNYTEQKKKKKIIIIIKTVKKSTKISLKQKTTYKLKFYNFFLN